MKKRSNIWERGKGREMERRYQVDILCKECNKYYWVYISKELSPDLFFKVPQNQICKYCNKKHGKKV